jgi:hypothetical protein
VQLALKHLQPLAKGNARLVYEHPDDPALLVKVMRPDLVKSRSGEGTAWFRGLGRRYDPYVLFLREICEYVAAYAAHGQALPYAQKVRGMVETDLGLGLIIVAVRGPDGALAPTVAKLIAIGNFDETARRALDETLASLLESDIVLADLHERNLVYQQKDGASHFVIIDGLGSSTLLPFKSWSRTLNRRSKLKRIARLRKRIAGRVAAFESGNPMP